MYSSSDTGFKCCVALVNVDSNIVAIGSISFNLAQIPQAFLSSLKTEALVRHDLWNVSKDVDW